MNAEKLLRMCADTMKMPGWNDALSRMTDKNAVYALPDEFLENVAGGVVNSEIPNAVNPQFDGQRE